MHAPVCGGDASAVDVTKRTTSCFLTVTAKDTEADAEACSQCMFQSEVWRHHPQSCYSYKMMSAAKKLV